MLDVNFHPFPILTTERLILREITKDDAKEVLYLRSDDEVMRYIDRPRAETIEDALVFMGRVEDGIKNNNGINWGMTLKNDNTLIGIISFWRIEKENYRAEIGYMLSPRFHRMGLMQEAITVCIDYAFNVLKLHSIQGNINPANTASASILEKNGFVKEAYFKENYYFNGKFLDSIIYSLLAPKE
jgi:[ribosomal protein S5]-alanine N-acetyltransferase